LQLWRRALLDQRRVVLDVDRISVAVAALRKVERVAAAVEERKPNGLALPGGPHQNWFGKALAARQPSQVQDWKNEKARARPSRARHSSASFPKSGKAASVS